MKEQTLGPLLLAIVMLLIAVLLMRSSDSIIDKRIAVLDARHKAQLDNRRQECYQHSGMWIFEKFYTKEGSLYETKYRCVNSIDEGEGETPVSETNNSDPSTTIPETSTLTSLGEPVKLKGE